MKSINVDLSSHQMGNRQQELKKKHTDVRIFKLKLCFGVNENFPDEHYKLSARKFPIRTAMAAVVGTSAPALKSNNVPAS